MKNTSVAKHLLIAGAIFICIVIVSAYQSVNAMATESVTRYTDGSFVKSLDVILEKEYTGVTRIDFEGTPGGELCGAAIKATAYDASGKSTDLGTTSRKDAHKTATRSVTFSTPIKVKKITGKPTGDGNMFTSDCSYIDHLKVTIYYTVTTNTLSVAKSGTGTGTVTSSPAGISCGSTCSKSYAGGTSVTLSATPAIGSKFISWSGDCTGTATTCTVKMDKAKSVTANFAVETPSLSDLVVTNVIVSKDYSNPVPAKSIPFGGSFYVFADVKNNGPGTLEIKESKEFIGVCENENFKTPCNAVLGIFELNFVLAPGENIREYVGQVFYEPAGTIPRSGNSYSSSGMHTYILTVDPTNAIKETYETNNDYLFKVNITK